MLKECLNQVAYAILIVLAIFGAGTIVVISTQGCSAQNNKSIQDLTQTEYDSLLESNKNLQIQVEDCIRTIDAYRTYYNRVESLLDKAGVDVDSPLLETDEGAEYLDKKWIVDSLENENLGTPSINK